MAAASLHYAWPHKIYTSPKLPEVTQEGVQLSCSWRSINKVLHSRYDGDRLQRKKGTWSLVRSKSRGNFTVLCSFVASPAGEVVISSEKKVYDVVLKQAALVKKQLSSNLTRDAKPELIVPRTQNLLKEAYDRCGEVCAEYAKTFYLG